MAGCLKCPFICLSIFLLVLPLVCSKDEKSNGKNDVKESVQNLLKSEKERRQQSKDTHSKGSGGIEQGQTHDDGNVPEIKPLQLLGGGFKPGIRRKRALTQMSIQDCENKYELILAKNDDKGGGSCYLHKMNDRVYQKDCLGIKTEEEVNVKCLCLRFGSTKMNIVFCVLGSLVEEMQLYRLITCYTFEINYKKFCFVMSLCEN
ncbi:hypothetical protein ACJMK2_012886 [Sinanodonta woodiana]|uniref:Uncharacterized protein n=1 Tax=Sinanodonta woodiana TaxID=1069815 RepID=A0ABD3V9M8_SINWO